MPKTISMVYRNYRGEVSTRRVQPYNIFWDKTKWHPEYQWLMEAYDLDKGAIRVFALKDCDFRRATDRQEGEG